MTGPCSVLDCRTAAVRRGMCNPHYRRWLTYGDPLGGGSLRDNRPLERRLSDGYRVTGDGCWQWTRQINDAGYGLVRWRHRGVRAHRAMYELVVGPIPEGLHLDHLCQNRACINPDHLEPVTHAENMRRKIDRNSVCKRGHPFDGIKRSDGSRYCKVCANWGRRTMRPLVKVVR